MAGKIILELPANTIGGDVLVSTETREAAEAARDQAVLAAENSGNLASATVTTLAPGATATVELSGPLNARVAAFGIPAGLDGSNVLPTDTAIAQAISTPGSATQTQLNATFGGIIPTFPTITEAEVALGNGGLTVGQKFFIMGAAS